jgi:hypothetical protein
MKYFALSYFPFCWLIVEITEYILSLLEALLLTSHNLHFISYSIAILKGIVHKLITLHVVFHITLRWYKNPVPTAVIRAQYRYRNVPQPWNAFQPLLNDRWFTLKKGIVFCNETMSCNQPHWCGLDIGAFDCPDTLHCTYLPLTFHISYQNPFLSYRIPFTNALHFTTLYIEMKVKWRVWDVCLMGYVLWQDKELKEFERIKTY